MSKVLYVPEKAARSGIAVEWTKSSQSLYIHGWYDSLVGLEGQRFTLHDFLQALEITEKDCKQAFDSTRGAPAPRKRKSRS